jgi:hypothetical protein
MILEELIVREAENEAVETNSSAAEDMVIGVIKERESS